MYTKPTPPPTTSRHHTPHPPPHPRQPSQGKVITTCQAPLLTPLAREYLYINSNVPSFTPPTAPTSPRYTHHCPHPPPHPRPFTPHLRQLSRSKAGVTCHVRSGRRHCPHPPHASPAVAIRRSHHYMPRPPSPCLIREHLYINSLVPNLLHPRPHLPRPAPILRTRSSIHCTSKHTHFPIILHPSHNPLQPFHTFPHP